MVETVKLDNKQEEAIYKMIIEEIADNLDCEIDNGRWTTKVITYTDDVPYDVEVNYRGSIGGHWYGNDRNEEPEWEWTWVELQVRHVRFYDPDEGDEIFTDFSCDNKRVLDGVKKILLGDE